MDVVFGTMRANELLSVVISNTLKSARIVAELRHGVARSSKVCSAKRAWLPQAILSLVTAFPVETWNQHAAGSDGIARSTNSVEGWHHGLQSLFQCHHPTVWTFMCGIQRDIQRQKALFLQGTTGASHPSARKYRALNDRDPSRRSSWSRRSTCISIFVPSRTCRMHELWVL